MKKRILSIIIALLFFSTPAWANGIIFHKNRLLKVAGGTFTAANARNSFVDGTAFTCFDTDLSAYAGTDAGSTPYFIQLQDASGDIASGYLGAVGGGWTFGAELLADLIFGTNCGVNWTCGDGWSIADGVGVANVASNQGIYQPISYSTSALYKSLINIVTNTGGGNSGFTFNPFGATKQYVSPEAGIKTLYSVAISSNWMIRGIFGYGAVGTIDDASCKQVTDCAATGLHIMSTKNGTTRNWQSISATFGYNDNISYRIYRVY